MDKAKEEYNRDLINYYGRVIAPSFSRVSGIASPRLVSFSKAFLLLSIVNLLSALFAPMDDCDEVYNYWEPLHFLFKGYGFQTWEYSPRFALRSYSYLLFFKPLAHLFYVLSGNKIAVFYCIKIFLGLFCAYCQSSFYYSLGRLLHPKIGQYALITMLFGTGMFISSTALLPNSFSMYFVFLIVSNWVQQRVHPLFLCCAIIFIWGWPFALIAVIFHALFSVELRIFDGKGTNLGSDILKSNKLDEKDMRIEYSLKFNLYHNLRVVIVAAIISFVYFLIPAVYFDKLCYGQWTISSINLIFYNVFKPSGAGPELYGVEPVSFYFSNGLLNFNLMFLMSLLALPLMALVWRFNKLPDVFKSFTFDELLYWSTIPFYFGLFVFTMQSHKEERFIFSMYPLLVLNSAIGVYALEVLLSIMALKVPYLKAAATKGTRFCIRCLFIAFVLVSVSRNLSLYLNFNAFRNLMYDFHQEKIHPNTNLCIGKEWYRFPGSFFLPENARLRFLQSDFKGLLPSYYSESGNGTAEMPYTVNIFNKEEMDRYTSRANCDYYIDYKTANVTISKNKFTQFDSKDLEKSFKKLKCYPYLDLYESPFPYRSLYIPGMQNVYYPYCLWKRT